MKCRFIKVIFLAFIVFLTHFSSSAQKKVWLRLDMARGSEYKLITEVEGKQFSDSAFTELTSDYLIHMEANIKVLDITKAGIHTLKKTFTRITVKQNLKDQEYYYDTDTEVSEENMFATQMAKEYKEMINFPISVKLDESGKIVSRQDSLSAIERKVLSYMVNNFMEFPEQKIFRGYTWQVKKSGQELNGMEGMDITLNYTVTEITPKGICISLNTRSDDIHLDKQKSAIFDQYDLKMLGEIIIDTKTGKILSKTINQTLHIKTFTMTFNSEGHIKTWIEE